MEHLIAIERNSNGEIISFQTSTGRVISFRKALQEIEEGKIIGAALNDRVENELPAIMNIKEEFDPTFTNYPPIF